MTVDFMKERAKRTIVEDLSHECYWSEEEERDIYYDEEGTTPKQAAKDLREFLDETMGLELRHMLAIELAIKELHKAESEG